VNRDKQNTGKAGSDLLQVPVEKPTAKSTISMSEIEPLCLEMK